MALAQTAFGAHESWEEEDPIAAYKGASDPYEEYSGRSLQPKIYKFHFRRAPSEILRKSDSEVAGLFAALRDEWREATLFESNLDRIVLNSAYQRIIGLGPQVIPYILKDLDETRDHWFWALAAIVGEDKAVGQTSIGAAAEAWLAWGKAAGIFDA